ncbi:MAG TPA: DUF559 domain-containing protein [Nitrospiraceae bacterium]|nr:DUF559 domain-containing protein [Nitrospiraceae bacterium]
MLNLALTRNGQHGWSQGFRVLRFWNNDVLTNIESVKELIWKELKSLPPPFLPRKVGGLKDE